MSRKIIEDAIYEMTDESGYISFDAFTNLIFEKDVSDEIALKFLKDAHKFKELQRLYENLIIRAESLSVSNDKQEQKFDDLISAIVKFKHASILFDLEDVVRIPQIFEDLYLEYGSNNAG